MEEERSQSFALAWIKLGGDMVQRLRLLAATF
jgi:hypothetical protein